MEHRADVASCPGPAEVAPQLLIPSPNMAAPIWLRLRDLFPRFQTRNIDKSQRGPQSRQRWMEGKERGQEKKKEKVTELVTGYSIFVVWYILPRLFDF